MAESEVQPFCMGQSTMNHAGFFSPTPDQSCVVFLFQTLVLDSPVKFAFGVIGTFFMAVLVEFLSSVPTKRFLARAAIYLTQTTLAYALMLLSMTYSWYIFWAIVFGLAVGHSAFNFNQRDDICCVISGQSTGNPQQVSSNENLMGTKVIESGEGSSQPETVNELLVV